jgi:hypothetical protein
MTDFLTRLAQRTLGLASVVQPQLASRYEPAVEVMIATNPPEAFTAPQPASALSASPEIAPNISQSTSSPTTATNNPISLPPTEKTLLSAAEAPQKSTENSTSSPRPSFSSTAHASANWVTNTPLQPQLNLENQAIVSMSLSEGIEPQPRFRESSTSSPQSFKDAEQRIQADSAHLPLVPASLPHSSSPSWNPIQEASTDRRADDRRAEQMSISQETSIKSPLVTLQDPMGSALGSAPSSRFHVSSPTPQPIKQPEPSIEIRIDRIEVRGTQPTPPKQRPKSTPSDPALSLSDYLNQRDGGRP